jgi:serine/threonine protein kinase
VREIFDAALRRQPEERRKFVNQACGDDKTLLAEVESLLSSIDSAESFMETPAVAKVAHMIEVETKKLETGKCFGHYEIINQIGEGGMGEVYLAKDTRLERKAAIKVLRGNVAQDEERMRRFVREAKSASALNHPNIITIYEIGSLIFKLSRGLIRCATTRALMKWSGASVFRNHRLLYPLLKQFHRWGLHSVRSVMFIAS